jgi:hypothetical protein
VYTATGSAAVAVVVAAAAAVAAGQEWPKLEACHGDAEGMRMLKV